MQLHDNEWHVLGDSMTITSPAPAGNRMAALDVVRGVAILGTFGANVWIFTDPAGPTGLLGADGTAGSLLLFLANGKFLALLTLMFGVGLELQHRSALRRGASWPGRYPVRAALLFAEGLLHYLLIFEFDVLMSYAVTSLLVAHLIGRGDRAVRWWIAGCGAVHLLLVALGTAGLLSSRAPIAGAGTDLFSHGGYLAQVAARIDGFAAYRLEALFIIPMSVAMFLIGSRLRRAGAFERGPGGQRLRNRFALVGLGIALPLNLLTTLAGQQWFLVDRYVLPPFVALGLLGSITSLVLRGGEPGPVRRGLGSVGRTALSCYVLQNLLAAILCYGWGFGLEVRFEPLRPWWVVLLWAVICGLLLWLSGRWLRRFERGPLELVMHRFYGR
ncbi:DUF418 domain-containing protein [Saccharopolyspora sp. NPDC047091]|uniref:DUF418 domain-containing protein n=1 Tax=Saccharopolyspora sp. NPDC047091 TaxID=3155924 RepID=UPI0033DFBA58